MTHTPSTPAGRSWGSLTNEEAWEIVLENEGLVKKVTDAYTRRHPALDFEEWYSAALIAAQGGVMTYDPGRGAQLSTHLWTCIWNGLRKAQQSEQTAYRRISVAGKRIYQQFEVLVDGRFPIDDTDIEGRESFNDVGLHYFDGRIDEGSDFEEDLVERLDDEAAIAEITEALDKLEPEERMYVELHDAEGMSFRQIGEQVGLAHETVRIRYRSGLTKLRDALGVAA